MIVGCLEGCEGLCCAVCVLAAFAVGYWIRNHAGLGKRGGGKYLGGEQAPVFPVYHGGRMPPSSGSIPQTHSSAKSSSGGIGPTLTGAAPGAWHHAVAAAAAAVGIGGSAAGAGAADAGGRRVQRQSGSRPRSVRYSDQQYDERSSQSARRSAASTRAGSCDPGGAAPAANRKQQDRISSAFSASSARSARLARSMLLGEDSSGAHVPLLDSGSQKSNSTSMGTGFTVKEQVGNAIRRMEGELLEQGEATLEEQLKIDNLIGRGAFGTVYRGAFLPLSVDLYMITLFGWGTRYLLTHTLPMLALSTNLKANS